VIACSRGEDVGLARFNAFGQSTPFTGNLYRSVNGFTTTGQTYELVIAKDFVESSAQPAVVGVVERKVDHSGLLEGCNCRGQDPRMVMARVDDREHAKRVNEFVALHVPGLCILGFLESNLIVKRLLEGVCSTRGDGVQGVKAG